MTDTVADAPTAEKETFAPPRLFHCGVLPECPIDVVHIAGLEFPRITQKITGYGADQKNTELLGVVHSIDGRRLELIEERAKTKFVRSTTGKNCSSVMKTTECKHYAPMEGDVPILDLIYLRPADHDPQFELRQKPLSETGLESAAVDLEEGYAELEKARAVIDEASAELVAERRRFEAERSSFEEVVKESGHSVQPAKPKGKGKGSK